VNPQGPNGNPDPVAAARDIRETFARMAMNDEETVALIAGGHTFGKAHGAAALSHLGREPEAAPLEQMGLGWRNSFGSGSGPHTITTGIEGAWKPRPTTWDQGYLETLFGHEWELVTGPGGAHQWRPTNDGGAATVVDAHDPATFHAPMMTTADLALRADPAYEAIALRFRAEPAAFADAFAQAWFKLTHRDLGPRARYRGSWVPAEVMIWQDPVPLPDHPLVGAADIAALKARVLESGLPAADLIAAAWASASTFRGGDKRGGSNGARVRLAPQKDWAVNQPGTLAAVLRRLDEIRLGFASTQHDGKRISLADLIVLAGDAAVEAAAGRAGITLALPFVPGRSDATQAQTDIASFAVLEPRADGFRNFVAPGLEEQAAALLVDKAQQLTLSAPEMTVLVGGLRVLGANTGGTPHGAFTARPGVLGNDFFVHLLDMGTLWSRTATPGVLQGRDRRTDAPRWTATTVDLAFGSNAQLRALAEVYASADAGQTFVQDFAAAWGKVMNLGRFERR